MDHTPEGLNRNQRHRLARWLGEEFVFTHFVTLTTHAPLLSRRRLRHLVREWDARMNRALYGPKWRKHTDELIWSFAFLEKPSANPHWHLLLRLGEPDGEKRERQSAKLEEFASPIWQRLVRSGDADVRKIDGGQMKVAHYLTKELKGTIQYEDFVTPDEFRA